MQRLVEPAVRAAASGFPLSAFQAYLFTVIAPILTASEGVARIFAPGGRLMQAGAIFRNDELAECLEWLAEDGARLFVDGDVGPAIVDGVARATAASSPRTISSAIASSSASRFIGAIRARAWPSTRRRRRRAR